MRAECRDKNKGKKEVLYKYGIKKISERSKHNTKNNGEKKNKIIQP
jgi:hypothetical protein